MLVWIKVMSTIVLLLWKLSTWLLISLSSNYLPYIRYIQLLQCNIIQLSNQQKILSKALASLLFHVLQYFIYPIQLTISHPTCRHTNKNATIFYMACMVAKFFNCGDTPDGTSHAFSCSCFRMKTLMLVVTLWAWSMTHTLIMVQLTKCNYYPFRKTLMDRQKVKRKLDMIKFDLENRTMMANNQQKMQDTRSMMSIIRYPLLSTGKRQRWNKSWLKQKEHWKE